MVASMGSFLMVDNTGASGRCQPAGAVDVAWQAAYFVSGGWSASLAPK